MHALIAYYLIIGLWGYYVVWFLLLILYKIFLRHGKNKNIVIKEENLQKNDDADKEGDEIPKNFVRDDNVKLGHFGWAFFIPFILIGILMLFAFIKIKIDG
ncbi:MAG: hypothetical protein Q4D61_04475 [Cardiobacteriaceae bacterium]|nr:hypothetical protein [Cardiobacteriaceae bacterium]